ncbi:MAG: PAS domain-containing sensor histidine kinase [Anaerolineae bacterium]|jgi:two-component system sensor histidine kinase VicK|nr:PAS domain-containing sensor histidine kinase [Anaerolineae bacterium]
MPDRITTRSRIYDFLFLTTDNGVIITDSDQEIQQLNPAAAAMLGVTLDEVLGRPPQECFARNPALIHLLTRPGEQRQDVRLARKRLAQGIGSDLPNGGRIVLLQDVTERREVENRREMLAKAIAHDLRNPISAITGFADLVSRFGALNDQQRKYLQRARQTSAKLHDMIVSLVDLAWIEAGMPLRHVPVRLDELIDQTLDGLAQMAQKARIGIATSVQKPLPTVMGDPERLQLAMHHLLHNAILYSYEEHNVAIHAWGDERELYCSVADQGIGIAENELDLVFDRMYRSRDERVLALPGGGLGLTVARTVIKRHGGDLWVSSTADEGSTFTFVLPAVRR